MAVPRSIIGRRLADNIVKMISGSAAGLGILALAWILFEVFAKGAAAINWTFLTAMPTPPFIEGGGLANAIAGTLLMTAIATLIAVPIGLLAGVYLAEFGHENRLAVSVRFLANALMGTPSIIIGLFIYTLIVVPTRTFSGYAGALALAILMLPVIARTSEDILKLVPNELRESALALGVPRWRTTVGIVFRAAKSGLLTGVLLAVARVSGETAPLLFTALNSRLWISSLAEPTANLTVTIYKYAMSPYPDWQQKAWGASLLITAGVLVTTIAARLIIQRGRGGSGR
ncbi:MAG TPA: phosphate ABC transporter permease PstA [Acidobacteriota bacterium]|nr:phosphate ABC transporter permease PstA [Acidobacteriota bacterium]